MKLASIKISDIMFNTQAPWNIGVTGVLTVGRALGVVYTNNTGKTMFVVVNLDMAAPNINAEAGVRIDVNTNTVATPTLDALDATTNISEIRIVTFFVPPGGTYLIDNISSDGGTVTIHRWVESY